MVEGTALTNSPAVYYFENIQIFDNNQIQLLID